MNPKERVITALECGTPDFVPTFELVFLLEKELLNKEIIPWETIEKEISLKEKDKMMHYNAEIIAEYVEILDYSIVRPGGITLETKLKMMSILEPLIGHRCLFDADSDPTLSIPAGSEMVEFVIRLKEHSIEVKEECERRVRESIEYVKKMAEGGARVVTMCADYCFNSGPFLSPKMFSEFVTPYLKKAIDGYRKAGVYSIKHTDGDIMPILDDLIECKPDAIHSLDPIAKVSMKTVKERVKNEICLCGNVNCAIIQTGTKDEVCEDAIRSLKEGMPGGGYIFCTSNCAFKGIPLENYLEMLKVRNEFGSYETLGEENTTQRLKKKK